MANHWHPETRKKMVCSESEYFLPIVLLKNIIAVAHWNGNISILHSMVSSHMIKFVQYHIFIYLWFLSNDQEFVYHPTFLNDRLWISTWMISMSNELDIIIHVIASQLSRYCDVISNRLWRHQQKEDRASETRGRCVKTVVFIVIYVFVMSYKI